MAGKPRQGRSAVPGLLIIAGLLSAAALIFALDGLVERSRDSFAVVALASEGTRLRTGSAALVAGRPVGRVETIEFVERTAERDEQLAVRVRLPAELRPLLRRDSRVRLARPRLIGDPAIDFVPGSARSPALQPGDTVRLEPVIDPLELAEQARTLLPAVDSLFITTAGLEPAIAERRARMAALGSTLPQTAARLDSLASHARGGSLSMLLSEPDVLEALDRAADDFGEVADRLRARAADAGELGPAFGRLARRVAIVQDGIDRIRADIEATGGGILTRMAADSAIAVEFRAVQAQLDSLVAESREDPLRYIF